MRHLVLRLAPLLFLTACVNPIAANRLRDELRDQGVVQVSPNNPYVVANQLLAKEASESEVVKGFLDLRGAPDAIEVRRPFFKPYRFYFFYLESNEGYLLEPLGAEWIVRGPEQIPADIVESKLANIKPTGGKAPLQLIRERPKAALPSTARQESPSAAPAPSATVPAAAVPAQGEAPPVRRKAATPWPETEAPKMIEADTPPVTNAIPASRDRRGSGAITTQLPSPRPAPERSAEPQLPPQAKSLSEDVIHVIQHPGETLRIIANWYTGDATNAERIARINGLENANQLSMGSSVRIPRYLLKTRAPLPESEIARYLDSLR